MLHFNDITLTTFLQDYWQKKPLLIRKALPDFINPITADELAGLSLEEEFESRIVYQTAEKEPYWHLIKGPFLETQFSSLPHTHWTLLVQGVDRLVPEVAALLNHFDFIPQWRLDDVMISFAAQQGSVGPHYDNYDVFLYQAQGRREWLLTSKDCHEGNYIEGLDLRIMKTFATEQRLILEEGDMLYLPPHIGHHGISLSDECMTYSFGYRSYQGQELWDSFGDYLSEKEAVKDLYQDPDWSDLKNTSEITAPAWQQARHILLKCINDDKLMKAWFACFATRLDQTAEQQLPQITEEEAADLPTLSAFIDELEQGASLQRNACCRFAYFKEESSNTCQIVINGCEWPVEGASTDLIMLVANNRLLTHEDLAPLLNHESNQLFLYNLWRIQWLEFLIE